MIVTIHRIWCIVTAAIELVNDDRRTTYLLNIYNDMTENSTALVVTAKHLAIFSAGDGQFHITFHVGIHRTSIDGLRPAFTTSHHHNQVTLNIGVLSSTVKFYDIQITSATSSFTDINITGNGSFRVATTISFVDIATRQQGRRISIDIGARISVPLLVQVVIILTITTTKDLFYLVGSSHLNISRRNSSSVTSTIDFPNTHVTAVDNHTDLTIRGFIVSQVTTTIDSSKFVSMWHAIIRNGISRIVRIFCCSCNIIKPLNCLVDSHCYITQGITIQVITTKDTTTFHHISMALVRVIGNIELSSRSRKVSCSIVFSLTQIHRNITIDQCLCSISSISCCNGCYLPVICCLISIITFAKVIISIISSCFFLSIFYTSHSSS